MGVPEIGTENRNSFSLDIVAAALVTNTSCQWPLSSTASDDSGIMLPLLPRLVLPPAVHPTATTVDIITTLPLVLLIVVRPHHPLIIVCYALNSHLRRCRAIPFAIAPFHLLSWLSCPQHPLLYPHIVTKPTIVVIITAVFLPPLPRSV
jgi:hypothetical protein